MQTGRPFLEVGTVPPFVRRSREMATQSVCITQIVGSIPACASLSAPRCLHHPLTVALVTVFVLTPVTRCSLIQS